MHRRCYTYTYAYDENARMNVCMCIVTYVEHKIESFLSNNAQRKQFYVVKKKQQQHKQSEKLKWEITRDKQNILIKHRDLYIKILYPYNIQCKHEMVIRNCI